MKALIRILVFAALLSEASFAAVVQVSWNANTESDLAGYKVYYGTSSRSYTVVVDVGNATQYSISGLNANTKYYFTVTAYDFNGNESGFSVEVFCVIKPLSPVLRFEKISF